MGLLRLSYPNPTGIQSVLVRNQPVDLRILQLEMVPPEEEILDEFWQPVLNSGVR